MSKDNITLLIFYLCMCGLMCMQVHVYTWVHVRMYEEVHMNGWKHSCMMIHVET